ncbi:hypothetical protein [Chromobacterium paludis]|uniref:hypothetical protein n=1 Tax=Chromobacterium paludis TaxID=2605945 RepID=UPI00143DF368|nr:hypothetical protein [Chromobacterium paludis]
MVYERNQTPQVWLENQLTRDGDILRVNWNHVDGLFPAGMVEDMLDCYMALLARLPWRRGGVDHPRRGDGAAGGGPGGARVRQRHGNAAAAGPAA